jgi:hypothetical protein
MGLLGNVDDLATDEQKAIGGVPLDLGAGRIIYVRQAGGLNREAAWKASGIAERMAPELEALDPRERDYRIYRQVSAELMVARWEGFTDPKGAEAPYSAEAALELFTASPETLEEVNKLATSPDAFRLATDKKKSSR